MNYFTYKLVAVVLSGALLVWAQSPTDLSPSEGSEQKTIANKEEEKPENVAKTLEERVESIVPLAPHIEQALLQLKGSEIVETARILSSSEYQGREAGTKGARRSARYIADRFREFGLLPGGTASTYFRPFKIQIGYKINSELQIFLAADKIAEYKRGEDYMPIHLIERKADISASCILVGYGITAPHMGFDEYSGIDVKGKVAIVFSGVPWNPGGSEWAPANQPRLDTIQYKVQNAEQHGATAVFIVDNPAGWRKELQVAERLNILDLQFPLKSSIPVVHARRKFVAELMMMKPEEIRLLALDIASTRAPQSMEIAGRELRFKSSIMGDAWIGRNIISILPGSDPELRQEAIVVGAHYDHLGEGMGENIYFGANDNAAGVSVILHMARAFASLEKRPRRTLVFINFDAEEIGRIGSSHYVSSPALPIGKTILMLNFDMVGRNEPDHIFAVGTLSSPQLHEIHIEMNRYVGLRLEHPESFRLGRSDHTAFYYAGVPIMYLFGGKDPDYHTPRDTWDKLIPEKLEKVAKLAFLTVWQTSERDERISYKAQ